MISPGYSGSSCVKLPTIALLLIAFLSSLRAQPVITTQPQSQTVPLGYDVTLRVKASGAPPLSYQWRFEGSPVAEATNSTLRLAAVQFTNAGGYSVIVSNIDGATPSLDASLVVTPPGSKLQSVTVTNAADFVYDSGRDVIYITTPTAIQRYHVGSNVFLTPLSCGVSLLGVDLSLDGNTLMAADHSLLTNKAVVWVVDLPTDSIQPMVFDAGFGESGLMWVAFGNDGAAMTTSDYAGAGMVPLRRIHPGSNSVSGITSVNLRAKLAGNATGTFMAINEGLSTDARLLLYNVATQAIVRTGPGTGTPGPLRPAVSPDGLQIAQPTTLSGGTFIYNSNFDVITSFPGQNGGVIYHPSNQFAFFAWGGSQQLRALRTDTFAEQWRYDFGDNISTDTRLRVSTDGSLVLALMNSAIKYLRWTNAEPVITNQPAHDHVGVGGNGVFGVGAMGPPPIRYQWRFQDEDIEGATNATLVVSNAQFANTGNYRVAVLGPNSFTLSSNATLFVNGPPQITQQPQGATLPAGTNHWLSVAAIGPAPYSYRWRLFGSNLPAPSAPTFNLINLQAASAGDYSVVVSNIFGSTTSQVATIAVTPTPPSIRQPPQDITAPAGTNVSFAMLAVGTEPMSYQWLFDGTMLPGRTAPSLLLTNIQSANAGAYSVLVSNAVGTNLTPTAILTVTPAPPRFVLQPQNVTATLGAEISFSAGAMGTDPIGYHWQFNGSGISDSTSTSYLLTNAQTVNVGSYTAVATNSVGNATSAVATLAITPPPGFLWTRSGGGTNADEGVSVAVDPAGNVFVAGSFSDTATIGGSNLVSAGGTDFFVARYDTAGNLAWIRQGGGASNDRAESIAVDGSGNVFVAGSLIGDATIGSVNLTGFGTVDLFLARYDSAGNLLWATNAGGSAEDGGLGVAVDNATNIYVTGWFGGTATFGGINLTAIGVADILVARYDASGNCVWARQPGGSSNEGGRAVACDPGGDILVAGDFFSPNVSFGPFTLINATSPSTGYDIFVAKYNSAGDVIWAARGGGTGSEFGPVAVRADAAGNAYVAGSFLTTATFGNFTLKSAGSFDVFVAKYGSGGTLQWIRSGGSSGLDTGNSLAVDAAGNSFVAGKFSGSANFGGTNQVVSSGNNDAFIAMYATTGDLIWVRKAGGVSADQAAAVAANREGNVYLSGYFNGAATFGHQTLIAGGSSEFFLSKLAAFDASQPPVLSVNPSNQTVLAGANLTLTPGFQSIEPFAAQWLFNGAELTGATNTTLVLSNLNIAQAGDYALVLSNVNGAITGAVATVNVTVEPDFGWTRRAGGASNDVALATLVEKISGDVYLAGYFTDTADFNGTILTSNGGEDAFLAHYTSSGALVWVKQFGGPGNDRATGIASRTSGSYAVCGNFADTVNFSGFPLTSAGGSDVFLLQINSGGFVNWAIRGGGTNNDAAFAVATHSIASGIYLTGLFQTNATFGSQMFTDITSSNKFFVAKYSDTGGFTWGATSTGAGPSEGRALACDAGNFVFVGGNCAGPANFGGQAIASTGALSGFVAKYSSGGNVASWARRFGTATNTPTFNNRVNGLAFDPAGNLLVAGEFQGEVGFINTNSTSSLTTNQPDAFLLKLDGAGTAQWVKTINGAGAETANSVVADVLGNAYVTGAFSNRTAIGNTTLTGAGGADAFVALFDTTGNLVNARRAGGAGDEAGQSISTDGAGKVFMAGAYSAPAAFGSNVVTNAGARDAFVTQLNFFASNIRPQFTTQPRSQSVAPGSNAILQVGVLSGISPTYTWRLNGVNIPGAVTNAYIVANAQLSKAGDYTVVVQNIFGATTSAVAKVALEVPPEYHWLQRSGGLGDDQALAVAVDATNGIYVAGLFSSVNSAFTNLTSVGGTDIFLAKYDSTGKFLWAKRAGGTGADVAQALRVDASGNVWLAGYFFSSVATFGNIALTNKSAPTAAHADLFLAKYDADGNPLWVRQGGGIGNPNIINQSDAATALALDPDGNAYLTGSFHSTVDLAGTQLENRGSTNFFVAKFNPNGGLLWARTTTGTNYSSGTGITVDAATNIYVTGFLLGSLNLGSGSLTNTNAAFIFGNGVVFVAKYDREGNIQWTRRAPGSGGFGQAIVADAFGSLYATSYKRDYGTGVSLTKYDPAGNALWYRTATLSCCTGDYISMAGLALDPFGNPIIAGYGNGIIEGITNSFQGGYVLKYRSDGSGYWILRCASQAATGTGSAAVAVDSAGHAVIAGRFNGTSSFGPFGAGNSNLVSAGVNDAFVVKLGQRPPMLTAPADQLVVAGSNATLQVSGSGGPQLYQWQFNGTNLATATNATLALGNFNFGKAGRYSVIVQGAGGASTSSVAGVGLIPVLSVGAASNAAWVNWDGVFTLQSAGQAAGAYADYFTGPGPVTNLIAPDEFQRYFRLRVPSPEVSGVFTSTNFALNFLGSPGRRYVIQTSTNLVNWTPVATDVFPFWYQDTNSAPQKFYRAILAP